MKKITLILALLLIPLGVFAADTATDQLVNEITNSSLLGTIRNAESTMMNLLNNNILNKTGGFATTVSLIGVSLLCYVGYIAFLMQQAKGKEIKKATNHIVKIMIIIGIGGTVLPLIDQLGTSLEGSFSSGIVKDLGTVTENIDILNNEHFQKQLETIQEAARSAGVSNEIGGTSLSAKLYWDEYLASEGYQDNLKIIALNAGVQKLVEDRSELTTENYATEDLIKNTNEIKKLIQAFDLNKSLFDWSFEEIIAYVLEIVGALLSLLMRVVQKLLLACFKLGFGIAISMSLFPKFEKTWEKYLRSYVSVTLWGVTLSIVSTLGSIVMYTMPQNPWTSCVLLFVISCFYLMTPAINSMIFGSEPGTAGMTNQIIGSGASVFAATSKGVNMILGYSKKATGIGSGGGGAKNSGGGSPSHPDGQQGV